MEEDFQHLFALIMDESLEDSYSHRNSKFAGVFC